MVPKIYLNDEDGLVKNGLHFHFPHLIEEKDPLRVPWQTIGQRHLQYIYL